MTPISLMILYTGLGLAMMILRRRQAAHALAALLPGLFWPLEIAAGCLLLASVPLCERETAESWRRRCKVVGDAIAKY